MPPDDLDGPAQVQVLLAHLASASSSSARPSPVPDVPNDTAWGESPESRKFSLPVNLSLVTSNTPGSQRPRPNRVTAGTRSPRPAEYQPMIGSVSPRCGCHSSSLGNSSRAALTPPP